MFICSFCKMPKIGPACLYCETLKQYGGIFAMSVDDIIRDFGGTP